MFLVILAALLSGCAYYGAPYARAYGPYYYDYYYYPHANVYFRLYTGDYYFPLGGTWHRSRVLPPSIHLDLRDRHALRIRDATPYLHDRLHRQAIHPPAGFRYQPTPAHDREARAFNRRGFDLYRKRYGH